MKNELYDEEVFDYSPEVATALIWWLTHLLGGKVTFPVDQGFWLNNFPETDSSRLILRKVDGNLQLIADTWS